MIAILDYAAGNQTSVLRALDFLGIPAVVTAEAAVIETAAGLIFPGVGAAGQAMHQLRASGLDQILKDWALAKRPLLGVCLGCQIMLEYSEENNMDTLGIIRGQTLRFQPGLREEDGRPISIPHMGWNGLKFIKPCLLFEGVPTEAEFYFVHSYYVRPSAEFIIANTVYGGEFCSVFGRAGLWALQFHVEKSGPAGLKVLQNYYNYCLEHPHA